MLKAFFGLACLVGIPAAASAQAAIVGTVRDPSGAHMSGVTVEATSASLIEKARTTLTDGNGRYRLEELRAGTYRLRFTRPGWKTHQLHNVELTGSFTATVDVELAVGAITETVTVVTDVPVVDGCGE